jgi:hypothetical protein
LILNLNYLHYESDTFGLIQGVFFKVAHYAKIMVEFPETVLKPVEVKVVEVIFDALTGLESFAVNIFGNLELSLCDALANAFVH